MDLPVGRLLEFLADQAPNRVCATCLAAELQTSFGCVRDTLVAIARQIVLAREAATCAGCGRETLVYGIVPTEARAPEDLVAAFFLGWQGSALCHTCLAHNLKLPLDPIEKAVWKLRLDHRVLVQSGQCSVCGHGRLVLMPTQLLRERTTPPR